MIHGTVESQMCLQLGNMQAACCALAVQLLLKFFPQDFDYFDTHSDPSDS